MTQKLYRAEFRAGLGTPTPITLHLVVPGVTAVGAACDAWAQARRLLAGQPGPRLERIQPLGGRP